MKRLPWLLAATAVVVATLLVWGIIRSPQKGGPMAETFDKATWQDEDAVYTPPYPRRQLARSALAGGLLRPGLSRDEVLDMLGPPTEAPYFADRDLVYWLGPEEGALSVDSSWLVIDFDPDGRLAVAEILTD